MEKKKPNQYKVMFWSFLRYTLLGLALKSVTGPYGFIIRRLVPLIADKMVKPIYDKLFRKYFKAKVIAKAKVKVKELDNAETSDDYLNTLNSK